MVTPNRQHIKLKGIKKKTNNGSPMSDKLLKSAVKIMFGEMFAKKCIIVGFAK